MKLPVFFRRVSGLGKAAVFGMTTAGEGGDIDSDR